MEEQARYVYKKVESGNIINTHTLMQEKEPVFDLRKIAWQPSWATRPGFQVA